MKHILLFIATWLIFTFQENALAVNNIPTNVWYAYSYGCTGSAYHQGSSPKTVADNVCFWAGQNASACAGWVPEKEPSIFSSYSYNGKIYRFDCTHNNGAYVANHFSIELSERKPSLKNRGRPACGLLAGNPINMGNGNKYEELVIIKDSAGNGFGIDIFYNSILDVDKKTLGAAWRHSYDRFLQTDLFEEAGYISAWRADGIGYGFKKNGNNWIASSDNTFRLIQNLDAHGNTTGWRLYHNNGEVEVYSKSGELQSITNRAGLTQNLVYSCKSTSETCTVVTPDAIAPEGGLLIEVSDSMGRSINFAYDNSSRIRIVKDPSGGVYTFNYSVDDNNNLSSVTYPDGKIKTYLYENTEFKNALTGIIDENGNRYATWVYDAVGKAVSSEHAGGGEKFTLSYNTTGPISEPNPVSTVVTDPRGSVRTYNFTTILGVVKITGQSQPGGAGCSASSSKITYDVNGNVASRTDFDGHKTIYQYDLNRNLETSRTEGLTSVGLTTDATRTITTTWHTAWSLPLVIREYSGAASTGTPLKITTHTYDDRGNLTSFTESDPALNLNRTTTIAYTYSSAVPGLVIGKVVDGPRTDVNDITTYSYYPHASICTPSSAAPMVDPQTGLSPENFGCRGKLKSVKNALNQTTTYNRYNHHGQVEQMTDANGLVTTMAYDLRQRLTSRTVGTETTTLTYDNVGQVIQLRIPDGSWLNYSYDASHRLTEVTDGLGNKMIYTLDSAGNRIKEESQDSNGNLAKALTRSYDVLNRLQAVTGIE